MQKTPPNFPAIGLPDEKQLAAMQDEFAAMQDEFFDNQWKKIGKDGLKGTVKKNFVKDMLNHVMIACTKKLIHFDYNPLDYNIATDLLEQGRIIEQIYYYHLFYTSHLTDEERAAKQKNEEYRSELAGLVSGNILVGNIFNVNLLKATTANSPEIIIYKIFANRILKTVASNAHGRDMSIVEALIVSVMGAIKGVVGLIADGQGSSAVALWRHIHEQECTLIALLKGKKQAIESYWSHQRFLKLEWDEDERLEQELEQKLAEYKLDKTEREKWKNRRSYINYGWLLEIDEFQKGFNKPYKLDFKNGLQTYAERSKWFVTYAEASKIIHSSGKMLTLSPEDYYRFVMMRLYETIGGLTKWMIPYIEANCFKDQNNDELLKFSNSIKRDLEQMAKNDKIILEKYSIQN